MNNEQFRRLVGNTPGKPKDDANQNPRPGAMSLGSRMRSNIPMTPRTLKGSGGIDFARQVAERDAASQPVKKFRSSAPKGSKLASGYHDRTKDRDNEEDDDKAQRVKALEETMKLGQIDQETFEKLRDQIIGGDIGSTHLVKGLDRKLLERIRRGEDVLQSGSGSTSEEMSTRSPPPDVDDELGRLEEKEIAPVVKEKTTKRGEMAPPAPVAGAKRNRDAILAELKASRKAAAQLKEPAQPSLGPKFRKIGDTEPRIKRDEKGREVLITVDEDGNVKRKVRKAKVMNDGESSSTRSLSTPIINTTPLGMEVPELPLIPAEKEDSDDDIFEGVGTEYDPLAGLGDDDEDESAPDEEHSPQDNAKKSPRASSRQESLNPENSISQPNEASKSRNYFSDSASRTDAQQSVDPLKDPTILAALKKVQKMKPTDEESDNDDVGDDARSTNDEEGDAEREARLRRRAAMLAATDRDLEDMDMGFGSSRFGDAEEAEDGGKVKLSEWKGAGGVDDEEGGDEHKGGKKRKRGPKKKKGDKNNAADVMKVMESRKKQI